MKRVLNLLTLLIASTAICLAEDTWTVAGSAAALNGTANWSETNTANDMTTTDGTTYTLTVEECTLEKGATYEYKVVKNHNWNNGANAYPAQNKQFTVAETAIYTVIYTFNTSTKAVNEQVNKTGNAGEVTHTYSVAGKPLSVFGGSKEWDEKNTSTTMTLGNDGLYTWTATDKTLAAKTSIEFKIVVDYDWGQSYPSSDVKQEIAENGVYDITFTFNPTTKAVGIIPNKKSDAEIETFYVVAGDNETLFGTKWDGSAEANKMAKNASDIWEKTYPDVTLSTGFIGWKVVMNGETWIPDGANKMIYVPEDGVYTLTFTYNETSGKVEGKLYDKDGKEVIVTPTGEGWPANYGGVMLQGFYWDSFKDSEWSTLMKQSDELSKYFDLIWVPNSGNCMSKGMGYMPVYWLNHTSNWGREKYLLNMISTFKEKGTKVLMDVVINHKSPLSKDGSWVDFANEEKTVTMPNGTSKTYTLNWTTADICRNDDGGYTNEVGKLMGWEVTGNDDTGDDFSGGRDLDHTSENVQNNVKSYLDFLRNYLGYSGFRLDMVKGYSPYYTKMYNEASKPEFCVGEYWDGSFDNVTDWISKTGFTSAAFDFPLKYVIRDAFGGENWSALSSKGIAGSPDWQRYSVTFIDNHDTYENQDRLTKNVLAAYAFILSMPGTPCVFLKHWQKYPIALSNMILSRKACGINNQSPIIEQGEQSGGYVIKTKGINGTMLCISGNVQNYDTNGFTKIISGTNYALFVSDNVNVEGLREGNDLLDFTKTVNVYVEAEKKPYIYSWTEGGEERSGTWPGNVMTEQETISDKTFWKYTFNVAPINVVINDGNGNQIPALTDLYHDTYLTYDGNTSYSDITAAYWTPEVPTCVKVIDGHVYAYFRANKDYDTPYAWVWNDSKNFCTTKEFPGDLMELVGFDDDNYPVFCWDGGEIGITDEMPTQILISNNGSETIRTANLEFKNANYYDATGYIGNAIISTGISDTVISNTVKPAASVWFNLNGQRVSKPAKGLYIQNGRKVVVR